MTDTGMCVLVFSNAEVRPRNQAMRVNIDAVHCIMAWYGCYHAGDRYTVTVDGRNVAMNNNGEPLEPKP